MGTHSADALFVEPVTSVPGQLPPVAISGLYKSLYRPVPIVKLSVNKGQQERKKEKKRNRKRHEDAKQDNALPAPYKEKKFIHSAYRYRAS